MGINSTGYRFNKPFHAEKAIPNTSGYDSTLWKLIGLILVVGLIILFDATFVRGAHFFNDASHDVKMQIIYAAAGIPLMLITSRLNPLLWRKYALVLMILAIALCVAVLIDGVGKEVNGSRRWLSFGMGGFSLNLQPSEFAKLAVILYISFIFSIAYIRKSRPAFTNGNDIVVPMWVIPAILCLSLILIVEQEPDLGTALIIAGITIGLLIVGGVRWWIIGLILIIGVVGAYFMIQRESYRNERIKAWINPWNYYTKTGYQPARSMLAVGSGGIKGVGIGEGREKRFLPAQSTDYIFATVAEETGFIGSLLFMSIIFFMVKQCFFIGARAKEPFNALVAKGIGIWIGVQTIINIAVVTGAMPSVGVPMPFVSYGGSSLCILLISMGIVQSIARSESQIILEGNRR